MGGAAGLGKSKSAAIVALGAAAGLGAAVVGSGGCKGGKERIRRTADAGTAVEVVTGDPETRRKVSVVEREPNDRPAEAGALPLESVGRGRFDSPADVDRYRVKIAQPGALTVTVSGLAAVDLVLELRDEADQVLARSDRGGAKLSEGIGGYPVTPGSYDVVVRSFQKAAKPTKGKDAKKKAEPAPQGDAGAVGSGAPVVMTEASEEYEVIATSSPTAAGPAPGHELEPNADAGTASDLAVGETGIGLIGWSGDVDVWKLGTEVLAANNALDVEVTGLEGVTLTVEVRDGMSRPQTTRKGARGQPVSIRGYLPKIPEGTPPILYVAVSGERSHPQAEYQLKAGVRVFTPTEELEPNDKPEQAQPFATAGEGGEGGDGGEPVTTLRASWDAGDVDCFALPEAATARRLEVTVNAAEGTNLAAELLVGGRVVAKSDEPAGKLEHVVAEIPAGAKAIVRVRGSAKPGAAASYDVSWAEVAAPDAMPPEEGESSTQ
jgi:hypothetical protein